MPRRPALVVLGLLLVVGCEQGPVVGVAHPSPASSSRVATLSRSAASLLPSPAAAAGESISEIYAVSADEAWVVLDRHVQETSDGGARWTDVTPPAVASGHLGHLVLDDAGHTWLTVADDARHVHLERSDDMGRSWVEVGSFDGIGGGVTWADPQHLWLVDSLGFAAGSEGVALYSSRDGGATWTEVAVSNPNSSTSAPGLPLACHKGPFSFASATVGWAGVDCAGGAPYLLTTEDGGRSWTARQLPVPDGGTPEPFASLAIFFGPSVGVASVTTHGVGHELFLRTNDGGQTWIQSGGIKSTGEPAILSPTTWIGRDQGALVITRDAGRTWSGVAPEAPNGQIHFISDRVAWASVRSDGSSRLERSIDGGRTWSSVAVPGIA